MTRRAFVSFPPRSRAMAVILRECDSRTTSPNVGRSNRSSAQARSGSGGGLLSRDGHLTRVLVLLLASLIAAACAAVRTNIAVNHTLPPTGAGKTVAIVPYTEKLAAAPDYQTHASKLAVRLEAEGYRIVPATGTPPPDYLAYFHYQIDSGTQANLPSRPHPPTGSLFAYRYRTALSPGARPLYRRMVMLEILDSARFRPNEPASFLDARVYSASVTSQGACSMMEQVIDPMLTALFQDFPGESGRLQTLDIRADSACGLDPFG